MQKANGVVNTKPTEELVIRLDFKGTIRKFFIITAIISVVAVFVNYPSSESLGDYDLWWHMALGKYYFENKTMTVDHTIFSWTKTDPRWIYNTWLGSFLLFIFYRFLGPFGIWFIQFALLAGIAFLSIFLLIKVLKERINEFYVLLLTASFQALSLVAIFIKPENFTMLCYAVLAFTYILGRVRDNYRYYFIFPPLFILWVNLHGAFLMGLVFLSIVVLFELVSGIFGLDKGFTKKKALTLIIVLLGSYLATLINPYGIKYLTSTYDFMTNEEFQKQIPQILAYQKMWPHLIPKADIAIRFFIGAWTMMIVFLIHLYCFYYLFAKRRVIDGALIMVTVIVFFFSMSGGRYSIFFVIQSLFTLPYLIHRCNEISGSESHVVNDNIWVRLACSITALSIAIWVLWFNVTYLAGKHYFGTAFEEKNYLPHDSAEFVRESKLKVQIFNDYLIGGYLMWKLYPDYKVFIDPRQAPYWQEVAPDYFKLVNYFNLENFNSFNEKYKFKIAVLHMREINLIFTLLKSGDWKLGFIDAVSAVLIHKSIVPELSPETLATDVSPRRFRYIDSPATLLNLFNFYIYAGPVYANEILQIYERNVSAFYKNRKTDIESMRNSIAQKEEELRAKAQQR